jgi:fatty acid desaturase
MDQKLAYDGFKLRSEQLKALSVRRNAPALLRVLLHLATIVVVATALWQSRASWWVLPLMWIVGYPLAFLFNVLHETAHQTAFKSRLLNYLFGHLAGLAVLLPYEYYRAFHWEHHRHTQQAGLDPEMTLVLPKSRLAYVWLMLGFPLWYKRMLTGLWRHALGRANEPWVVAQRRSLIVREARLYVVAYAVIATTSVWLGSWAAVYLWLLPLTAGQMVLRPYLLAEHTGCAHNDNMLQNTRTIYTSALVRFFAWNMPFHAEHHAYPSVPFHALPQLNALTRDHLAVTANGYLDATRQVYHHLLCVNPGSKQLRQDTR